MTRQERNQLAADALAAAKFTTGSGHARTNCPFCITKVGKEDRSQCLAIHVTSGWYGCWRCHTKGRLDGFEDAEVEVPEPQPKVVHGAPEGFYELGRGPGNTAEVFEEARDYLRQRLPDIEVWQAAGIGASLKGKAAFRIVVPVLSPRGEWWGWVGRDYTGLNERKYLNSPGMTVGSEGHLFNHQALSVRTSTPLLVVEGVFDALAHWPDAVAVLGKPTDPQLAALAAAPRPVVVVMDADAWREGEVLGWRLQMMGQRAGSVRLEGGLDPDEVDAQWLRARVVEALT